MAPKGIWYPLANGLTHSKHEAQGSWSSVLKHNDLRAAANLARRHTCTEFLLLTLCQSGRPHSQRTPLQAQRPIRGHTEKSIKGNYSKRLHLAMRGAKLPVLGWANRLYFASAPSPNEATAELCMSLKNSVCHRSGPDRHSSGEPVAMVK